MAQNQRIAGADFSGLGLGFTAPITSGLVGWYWLGGDAAKASANLVSVTAPAATPAGTMTHYQGYTAFAANAQMRTELPETAEITMIAVARHPTGGPSGVNGSVMGNYGVGQAPYTGSFGPFMALNSASTVQAGGGRDNGAGNVQQLTVTTTTTGSAAWNVIALTFGNASPLRVDNLRDGTSNTTVNTAARVVNTTRNILIGSFGLGGSTGPMDIAAAAIFNRQLSAAERTLLYTYFRTAMPIRSAGGIILP